MSSGVRCDEVGCAWLAAAVIPTDPIWRRSEHVRNARYGVIISA
jgi:hypothetical protein